MRPTRVLLATGAAILVLGGFAWAQPAPWPNAPAPGREGEMGGPGHGGGMRRMMASSKAARFEVRRGDVYIDIKCAAEEPMKACIDAANQLIDHLAAK